MRFTKRIFLAAVGIMTFTLGAVSAQDNAGHKVFMPIGGGYGDTFDAFIAAALNSKVGDTLKIVVLPSTYATNAEEITDEERQENVDAAEGRRSQIEEACIADVPEGVTCDVQLTPIFTRDDALNPDNVAYFTDDVGAVYILGGDQTVAMQVMVNTPVEEALQKAYNRGALIAGTSAGEAVQSKPMIGGYVGDFGPETGLNEGAVDIWNEGDKRGLDFGITSAILEQHFWERARLGRLMNVLAQPGVPTVGLGIDSYTAATITDGKTLNNIAGLYSIGILDAEAMNAAKYATFNGGILSMHTILFHILPPGDFSYDLETRETSIAPPLIFSGRDFEGLRPPGGAGTLILTGSLHAPFDKSTILARFVELSGGANANILTVYDGFASPDMLDGTAPYFEAGLEALGVTTITRWDVTSAAAPKSLDEYTGILFVGNVATIMHPDKLAPLKDAWLSGKPMLADWTASSVLGSFYAAEPQTPQATDEEPYADIDFIQGAFIDGKTNIQPGLGLLNAMFETRTLADYRVGRMVALAYAHPDTVAVGLNEETALEINVDGPTVLGTNGVFVLDLRFATLAKGTNDGFAYANGLLDSYAPGEKIIGGD